MIPVLVVALLACAALAFVVAPLRKGPIAADDGVSMAMDDATTRKHSALAAIVDLENERDIGKLSIQDFELLRRQYEVEALAALRDLDLLQAVGDEAELEAEIAAARAELSCPSCGALRRAGEQCPRCGA